MRCTRTLASAFGCTLCCALAVASPKSLEGKSLAPVDTVAQRPFHLPAQTLIRTLNDIGRLAGVAIEIRGPIPATAMAPEVSGSYTLPAVLRLVHKMHRIVRPFQRPYTTTIN